MTKKLRNEDGLVSKIHESLAEIADQGINLASDVQVLDEIPIVKWGVSAWRISDLLAKRRFVKNVAAFLKGLESTSPAERQRLLDQVLEEKHTYDEFVDTVLLILTEGEKPIKAQIVGNLTKALVDGAYNFTTYNHLCLLVHSSSVPALNNLAMCANEEMLTAIDELEKTHTSRKTYGLGPDMSTQITGVRTSTFLLSSMGVSAQGGKHLNGYGMTLVKYGRLAEVGSVLVDRFREKE